MTNVLQSMKLVIQMIELNIKFLYKKPAIAVFDSGASVSVISEKFYKELNNAVKISQHDTTTIIDASRNSLGPANQCYFNI